MRLGLLRACWFVLLIVAMGPLAPAEPASQTIAWLRNAQREQHRREVFAPTSTPALTQRNKSTALTLSDNFDDGSINQTLWQVSNSGANEQQGMLTLNSDSDSNVYLLTRQTVYAYADALELTVDYQDFTTSGSGICQVLLLSGTTAFVMSLTSGTTGRTVEFAAQKDTETTYTVHSTSAASGRLRLKLDPATRVMEGFIDEGSGWTRLGDSGSITLGAREGLYGGLLADGSAGATARVRMDNFSLQGDAYEPPTLGSTGLFESLTISSAGYNRQYRMLVPDNYQPDRPVGVLFGYQGYGSPYLGILQGDFEAAAETSYWICVSIPVKVAGGYSTVLNATNNEDIRCTTDIFNLLKTYYQLDENRVFALGFSNGAYFSVTLANTVPHFVAAINPNASPNWSTSPRLTRSDYACIACGGNADSYDSVGCVNALRAFFLGHGMDGELYACKMGHSTPSADAFVTPSKDWYAKVIDFFMTHPRDYQSTMNAPPALAESFRDDFDSAANRPDGTRWHLEYFDQNGLLGDIAGCVFRQANGGLVSELLGTGSQGGLCLSGYLADDVIWETSFTITSIGTGVTVWPAVLADMNGKLLALGMNGSTWTWQLADTHLALRAAQANSLRTVASGTAALNVGQSYRLRFTRHRGIEWNLEDATQQSVASGTLATSDALTGPVQVGFGLRTTTGAVSFGYAEANSTHVNRVEYWNGY